MRIAVAEDSRSSFGGVFTLAEVASLAGERVSGVPTEIFTGPAEVTDRVDAVLIDRDYSADAGVVTSTFFPGVPSAFVTLGRDIKKSPFIVQRTENEELVVDVSDIGGAITIIARWLEGFTPAAVSHGEHRQLEALVAELLKAIDSLNTTNQELREEIAQVRVAADTIALQLKAPRPTRSVIGWALGQVAQMPVGLATGLALPYLQELLHAFH